MIDIKVPALRTQPFVMNIISGIKIINFLSRTCAVLFMRTRLKIRAVRIGNLTEEFFGNGKSRNRRNNFDHDNGNQA